MRGDLGLDLRRVLRPEGALGLASVVAGGSALAAAYLPWYEVTATVAMLGDERSRAVASIAGWTAHPWAWLIPTVSLAVIVIGALLAIDRSLRSTADLLLTGGFLLALAVAVAGRWFPPVSRFDVAGTQLREMVALTGRLPSDVDIGFTVGPSVGMWLALASAVLLFAAGLATRALR